MKLLLAGKLSVISSILFVTYMVPSAITAQPSKENFELVWSDEFEVDGLPDSKNWGYEEGCSVRNSELQYYTKARIENAHIENGMLTIEARKEKMGNCNYTSANLVSNGKRSIKYGLFELRAKIDIRAGSWPAWWWLPSSGGWPKGGEIDMMEFYKGKTLLNVMDGSQKWYSKTKTVDAAWAGQFHVWTWVWDSLKIDLWLDNTLMNHYNVADANGTGPNGENPFRRPGYMLVNQAIGGNNGGDPGSTSFPVKYIVDYIRQYLPGKDTSAPKVVSVTAATGGGIRVIFSEAVDKASAEKLTNYAVTAAGVTLSSAKLQSDGQTVVITAAGLLIDDRHELTIQNISDRAATPNTLLSVKMAFTVVPESRKLAGTVIGKGTPYNGATGVAYEKAVDGNTSTFADCTGDPLWVGYDLGAGAPFIITGFRYYPRNGYADRMSGKSFEISTDGTVWEKAYTIPSAPTEGSYTAVSITDTKPVRYVRYNGLGGNLNVGEVEFWGFAAGGTGALTFNGERLLHPCGGSLLRPPFTVKVHSIDGRLLQNWSVDSHEAPVRLGGVLDRVSRAGVKPVPQIQIITIDDAGGHQVRFTAIPR